VLSSISSAGHIARQDLREVFLRSTAANPVYKLMKLQLMKRTTKILDKLEAVATFTKHAPVDAQMLEPGVTEGWSVKTS